MVLHARNKGRTGRYPDRQPSLSARRTARNCRGPFDAVGFIRTDGGIGPRGAPGLSIAKGAGWESKNFGGAPWPRHAICSVRKVANDDCVRCETVPASLRPRRFLSRGYLSDRDRPAHLEIIAGSEEQAKELVMMLTRMRIRSKAIARRGSFLIYLKGRDAISRF